MNFLKKMKDETYMTVIICAIRPEIKPFIRDLKSRRKKVLGNVKVYEGLLGDSEVILIQCGVGLKKSSDAVRSVINNTEVSRVIMSGTAGGLDKRLDIGDTIVSEEIIYHEYGNNFVDSITDKELLEIAKKAIGNASLPHKVYFGRISSGSKFISIKNKEQIIENNNSLCCDMETAAVAQVCQENKIPFIAVRSISDTKEKSGIINFFKYASLASENSYKVTKAILTSVKK
jgi:adenosylhomocysteine nucleosidase